MDKSPADLDVVGLRVEYTLGSHVSRVLDDLSFSAQDGEVVLALGASGCGKTTLLSVLAGLLRPTSGVAGFAGTEIGSLRGRDLLNYRRHSVGVVFQSFNLVPSLSALENVMAPLVLTGVGTGPARQLAARLLDDVAMSAHARKHPGQLSGGQQQRVAFARAMVHDPPLLLADEPTAHLDPEQFDGVLALINRLRGPGRLIVIATHDTRFHDVADAVVNLGEAQRGFAREDSGVAR